MLSKESKRDIPFDAFSYIEAESANSAPKFYSLNPVPLRIKLSDVPQEGLDSTARTELNAEIEFIAVVIDAAGNPINFLHLK